MKTESTRSLASRSTRHLVLVTGVIVFFIALAITPHLTSSASSASIAKALASRGNAEQPTRGSNGDYLNAARRPGFLSAMIPAPPESIETFAADCSTPKTAFSLGETVCAQTNDVDLMFPGGRWVHWLRPDLSIASGGSGTTLITTNPQTFSFVPDTTGTWKVTIAETGDDSQTPAIFTVNQSAPIATYAADCTTPKSLFELGDVVCARTVGVDPAFNRRFAWIGPSGLTRRFDPITSDPQTNSYTLPTTDTEVIDIFVVDNIGSWKVNVVSSRGSAVASAFFKVEGASPRVDLSIAKAGNGGSVQAGSNFTYTVAITNFGPNAAAGVEFKDPAPPDTSVVNATFVGVTQTAGPTFSCTGGAPLVCTLVGPAVLQPGETALFDIEYTATGAPGSTIANTANVSSTTVELKGADNTANSGRVDIEDGGTPPTCSLECPNNIIVPRDQAGGATVTFDSPDQFGNCGTTSYNHPSGSLFAVGTTTVTATSTTGGGSCSFTVTVIDAPNPTISCPSDKIAAAPSGALGTPVVTGTATAGPTDAGLTLTVSGVRDDDRPLSDPYPVGETFILWTVSDEYGRMATCSQKITVTSPDAPTISCPPNKSFTTADCSYTATAAEIGTPSTTGIGTLTVTNRRSDFLNLTDPYPAGVTVITWTVTDEAGRTASCTQTITVNSTGDTAAPTLTVPPDITVSTSSCSAVLDDELGVATADDNCSAVSLSRTGIPLVSCPIPGNPGRMCESFVFPTGTTNIVYTATDGSGNSTSAVQHVTVLESVPPTISAPANASYQCASQVPAASPSQATASDNCGTPTVTVSQTTNGGAGTTASPLVITRTFTATDASNNSASSVQTITVIDNTPPTITAPANASYQCPSEVPAANANQATASDNCVTPTVMVSEANNGGIGSTASPLIITRTFTATDAAGNSASAVQTITVIDNTPPTITCSANIVADFNPAVNCAVVTYTPPVGMDNCSGAATTQIAGLASGATFPIGTTTNTFKVTDAAGNTATCSFTVTVALTSIIGLDSVTITGSAQIDSYDSTGGYPTTKSSLANVLSNGTITIGNSGKVWGNVRSTRANINMTGAAQVTGNATAGTTVSTSGSATVLGTRTNNALAPVMTPPSVVACGPPYSSASGISGTYSYNQSTGDLTLSGVNIATLANGNYCFHNVTLGNSAQLKVNGPVVIKLTGTLNTSGATSLPNTTLIPSNLQILSSYSGSNGIVFGNSTALQLVVYAPQTGVNISGSVPLFGTVTAKSITIGGSGMIHYDTTLKNIWPAVWPLILGP